MLSGLLVQGRVYVTVHFIIENVVTGQTFFFILVAVSYRIGRVYTWVVAVD